MPQYLLSIIQPTGQQPPPPEVLDKIMADIDDWRSRLEAAGGWVFTAGLHAPSTATVVQQAGDDVLTTDGPFAEGKEYVGGFTVIRAADLDEALRWTRELARVLPLPIEVRPLVDDED